MDKYFGNAYRGDPGVPHSGGRRFVTIWSGSVGFSLCCIFNPYFRQVATEVSEFDREILHENHLMRKAEEEGKPYESRWNSLPQFYRENFYLHAPIYFP